MYERSKDVAAFGEDAFNAGCSGMLLLNHTGSVCSEAERCMVYIKRFSELAPLSTGKTRNLSISLSLSLLVLSFNARTRYEHVAA
jgi:hypothetical protein